MSSDLPLTIIHPAPTARDRLVADPPDEVLVDRIAAVLAQRFGPACADDRALAVLATARQWVLSGQISEFAPSVKGNFHHPPRGSARDWIEIAIGLADTQ